MDSKSRPETCLQVLGCYLASTGLLSTGDLNKLKSSAKNSWSLWDKSTWWNVEDHWNHNLETTRRLRSTKIQFLDRFYSN
ncbi:ALI_collapsed_G0025220.mRNA.1.CDS.1 [Saccharomyces cerevisiae]|nr:ALI_collapsed_G0025220.mRNA.1.CDS.1 [Saccharomyces cerevisiae]